MNQRKEELRKRRKGFVSLLTAAMLVTQMMPMGAWAEDLGDISSKTQLDKEYYIITSDEKLKWYTTAGSASTSIYYISATEESAASIGNTQSFVFTPDKTKLPNQFTDNDKAAIVGWEVGSFLTDTNYSEVAESYCLYISRLVANPRFGITYYLDGTQMTDDNWGTVEHDTAYTYGKGLQSLATPPVETGYTVEWYTDKAMTAENKVVTSATAANVISNTAKGTQTFYGKKVLETYDITYHLNDDQTNPAVNPDDNPTTYTYTAADITLSAPTRAGYTFAGWYADENYTKKYTSPEIPTNSTGDKTFYAKWKKNLNNDDDTTGFAITVTIPDEGYTYDGTAKQPTVTVVDCESGDTLVKDTDYTVDYQNNINAGENTGTVTVTAIDDSDNCAGEFTQTFTIAPAPLTVTAKNQTVDLGGTIQQGADQITVSDGELPDGHKITEVTLTADTSNATYDGVIAITEGSVKIVDAQEKDVTANYTITSVNGSLTVNRAEIGDIKITFPQTDETIPYNNDGETTDIPAFPYGTSVAPDISGAPDNAETTITYYRYLTDEEWDEVIEKYDLDPENPDEEALSAALAETFGGEYTGDGIMQYTEDDPPTFPGIYEAFAEAEIPDNDNYEHSYTDESFAIIPKPLTVTPASLSLTYGDKLPEKVKVTYDGIVKGDEDLFPAELPIDCDYTQFGDAKLYQDAVKLKTDALDAELKNYTLTSASADLTVNPKAITLTWDEFLTPTYDGKAHSMTYSIPEDSILNNDDVTIKLNGATETDAGAPYTASAELVGDKKDNYNLIAENLAWGIDKAPITPSVTIADWAYGAEPNEPVVEGNPGNGKVTYTYFDMDDNELEGVPTGVGTYIVKATIAETANYAEGKAKTVFEITKAEIQKDDPTFQIITKPFEGVYDGKAHAVSVSAPAQIAGAKVYFSATDQTEEEFVEANQTASPEYINAGEYTVYYCITSPHYETVFGTATVTIQKRGITVTAVDQTSTLGEALKSLTYRLDGEIVKGDDLGIKLTSYADKDTLGTSEIKVTYTENANYTVKTVDGTYTVAEASEPSSDPEEPASDPEEPASDPEEPASDPKEPASDTEEPASDPEEPASDPEEPASDPEEPASDPEEPASDPEEPASDPEEPASEPGFEPASDPASEPASTPGSTPSTKTSTDAASTPASEPASTPASDPASTPATKATTAATTKSTTTATTKTTTAVTTKTTTAATTKTTTTASTNSTTDASTTVPTPATTPASTKDTAPATTPSTTSSTPASTLPTTQDTDAGTTTTTAATTTTQPSTEDGTDDVNTTTAPETTDDSGTGKTPHTTEPVLVEYDLKLTVIGKDKAYYAHDPNVFKAEDLIASLRRRTVSTDGQMCEWQDVTDFSCIDMRGQSPQSLYNEAQKNFIFAPIKADITTTLPDGRVVKQEISLGSVLIVQEGDVNLDGKLNALDSYIVLVNAALAGAGLPTQYFGGDDEELERFARFIADVNGDGTADSIDAQALLMFAAYLGSGEHPTWAKILEILFSNT